MTVQCPDDHIFSLSLSGSQTAETASIESLFLGEPALSIAVPEDSAGRVPHTRGATSSLSRAFDL